jgi:lipopolysaccharide/colanic/teichoic acid biosynthesis glycosyltransferase
MTPPVDTLPAPIRPALSPPQPDRHQVGGQTPKTQLTADVVVITRDSHTELARSLASIRNAAAQAGAGLLFVDLGSTDETRNFAARHAPGAQGIWMDAHDGLSDALSAAAAWSTADVLVVVRPGLQPGSVEAITGLVTHLEEHPYAGAAAPTIRAQTGKVLRTAHPDPTPARFSRVEHVLGDAIAIRRTDAAAVATSRRRRSKSSEELDMCLALRRRGREIHYLTAVDWLDTSGALTARVKDDAARVARRGTRFRRRRHQPGLVARLLGRAFDIAIAAPLITVLAPLFLAIALAVRIDSRGPALFRQRRVGRDAKQFEMFKFRTMRHKADPGLHEQFVRDMIINRRRGDGDRSPPVFKIHPDPRITRVGRILRRTSLDELPQLFNILRGEMSFVGFRPPIPYEVANYPEWYFRRFDSKPGLTGLWQVSGRNQCSYEEMVCLDIEYVNRRSWRLDLTLLVRTIRVVISGRGAY